ncbi:flavonoid 3'-monooxygenase-like [Humulus lupulus]|uniref:flavonoid 3'-monooxygenase-like n=1 Tax=Humulus lupulus TaxID=3486 RepID=UPI002B40A838|nr:flavonoid 3'-monooxygenase-like [Humulus lupulus]
MFTNVKYYGHGLFDILILFSFAVSALIWFWWTTKKFSSKPPLPPGPRGLPLVGYLPYLSPNLHRDYSALAKIYGPIFKFWMGNKLCVVISSPQLIGQVVREHDTVFANRDVSIAALILTHGGNDIAFASYGPEWKKLRKIFAHEMSSNTVLNNLYGLRREEVRKSVRYLYERINTPVVIGRLVCQTAINSIMNMTIGASFEGVDATIDSAQIKKVTEDIVMLLGKFNISDIFPMLKWFDIQGIARDVTKITKMFEVMFDNAMAKRKNAIINHEANVSTTKDLLQFLMELHEDQDTKTPITMPEIKALLVDTILGATDTTTTSVEWAMAEILNKPVVLNKIQEELKQVVGLNNNVEESHLSKLTYLNAVLKVTLRLHPPAPFLIPRFPSQSVVVGGYTIPKGTAIFLNVWSMQRDPSVWENPLEFLPERFLGNESQGDINYNFSGQTFNYLPFGSGRRMCPGISLGEKMVMLMLASFLHCFDWKMPSGTKVELSDKFGIIVQKKDPLIAIPKPRFSDLDLYATA